MPEHYPPKLLQLVESEGFDDPQDLFQDVISDWVCPGICMNEGCDFVTDVEPDQDAGWCELCNTNTVKSGLMLAGLI
jgi:hypothetical protein